MKKQIFFRCGALLLLAALLPGLYLLLTGAGVPTANAAAADVLLMILALIVFLAGCFRLSLKRTLYAYRNAALLGAILFLTVLFFAFMFSFLFHRTGQPLSLRTALDFITEFPRQFSFFAIPVLFLVCIALGISNLALIRHEGFRPGNLLSVLLGALYIGGTVGIYSLSYLIDRTLADRIPETVFLIFRVYLPLFLLLMMCYFECVLVGCAVMGYLATRKIPAYDKDYIIILGCSIDKKGGLLPLLRGRTNRAVRFAWDQEIATGKRCRYVPSGGKGQNEIMSEGSAMEFYLLTHGAEDDEVFPEKQSANTYENMLFSKRIIDGLKPDARIAFATTNFHVYRSGILARMAGFDAEGIASSTKWYFWPNGFIREFFGILAIHKRFHVTVATAAALVCTVLAVLAILL